MRVLDYFFLSAKNLSRRKRTVITNVFLISLSLLIYIIGFTVTNSIQEFVEKSFNNNISYRSIYVNYDPDNESETDVINKLEQLENVDKVLRQDEYSTNVEIFKIGEKKVNGNITLLGGNEKISPNVIKGKSFKDSKENACIIPKIFYPYNIDGKENKEKYINGEDFLNKEIEINYYSYDYDSGYVPQRKQKFAKKLKIIGIYDTDENLGEKNEIYANIDCIGNINETILEGYQQNAVSLLIAVVNDSKNSEATIEKLKNMNYDASARSVVNKDFIDMINNVSVIIFVLVAIIAFINILIGVLKSIKERRNEIGMLKAIGFKKKNILIMLCTEAIIIGVISYIISILLSLIGTNLLTKIFENIDSELGKLNLILTNRVCYYSFFITIALPIIATIFASIPILRKMPSIISKEG